MYIWHLGQYTKLAIERTDKFRASDKFRHNEYQQQVLEPLLFFHLYV